MEREEEEWVQTTLVETERRRCAQRVTSFSSEDAVGKGENYGSVMKRLVLNVVTGEGEVEERKLIYKALPKTEFRKKMGKKVGSFVRESRIFIDVLPEMDRIRTKHEVVFDKMWPDFYGASRNYEALLVDDLSAKGYKNADRHKGLDFDHCRLVMHSLAKFHALGAVLNERDDLHVYELDSIFSRMKPQDFDTFYKNTLKRLADTLENKWKGEWVLYAEKVRHFSEDVSQRVFDSLLKRSDEVFCTLLHGDCWMNNIMFRYGKDGKPESLKFIDFQLSYYNHPGLDLQYFLQTSAGPDVRPRKMELVGLYQEALSSNLSVYGFTGTVPSLEDILAMYRSAGVYGLSVALGTMPLMMAPAEVAPDMEELSEKVVNKEEYTLSAYDYESDSMLKCLQHALKEGNENNLF